MLLGPPDGLILRPDPLRSTPLNWSCLLAPRDASSPVPPTVPPGVAASGSESEPVKSGSAASASLSPSFAAAFSLAAFQSIPVCSHYIIGTCVPGCLSATSHRPRIGRVAINCATVFCLRMIDVLIRTTPASFITPSRDG